VLKKATNKVLWQKGAGVEQKIRKKLQGSELDYC